MKTCPDPLAVFAWLEAGEPQDETGQHITDCAICSATAAAQRHTFHAEAQWQPEAVSALGKPHELFGSYAPSEPAPADVWLSSPYFEFDNAGYRDLDRLMFVVVDETVCEAGKRWVDVLPIWPDAALASDIDVVLSPAHTSLGLELRAQPARQLVLAYEQLERKVGEVFEEAFAALLSALQGEVDLEWRGTPYDGAQDWRLTFDGWLEAVLQTLRAPYEQALARADAALGTAGHAHAKLIPLVRYFGDLSDTHEMALAARGRRRDPPVWVDEAKCFEARLSVELATGLLAVAVNRVLSDWVRSVAIEVRFTDGFTTEAVLDHAPGIAHAKARGHTEQEIDSVFIKLGG
jgi:hypothetical protein